MSAAVDLRLTNAGIEAMPPGASNERRDRHIARNLYAARDVEEYWIGDPENHSVEVYRQNRDRENLLDNDELTSPLLPGFAVPVSTLFD